MRIASLRTPLFLALVACGTAATDDTTDDTGEVVDVDDDGVAAADDCDDDDASLGDKADDADCDGVLSAIDCDDDDADLGDRGDDADCDGLVATDDCDDDDSSSTAVADDADCDGVLTAADCDDTDDAITTAPDADPDCDGVDGLAFPPAAATGPGDVDGFFYGDTDMRSHALLYEEDLVGLSSGDVLYGFSLRLHGDVATAYTNAVTPTFDEFTVRLGVATDELGGVGDDFADHHTAPLTTVLSGTLTIADGAMKPATGVGQAAPWGPRIAFDTPYTYTGGDLLVEVLWERDASATELVIDVFEGMSTRSGGSVFAIGGENATIQSTWDANWAVLLYTTAP